jgi:hypothetical protein
MVRPTTEKTQVQKDYEKADKEYKAAQEAFNKAANAANTKRLETATADRKKDNQAVKRERFVKLGNLRLKKAIKAMEHLKRLANRANYDYSEDDAKLIISKVDDAFKALDQAFAAPVAGEAKTEDEDYFQ